MQGQTMIEKGLYENGVLRTSGGSQAHLLVLLKSATAFLVVLPALIKLHVNYKQLKQWPKSSISLVNQIT